MVNILQIKFVKLLLMMSEIRTKRVEMYGK